RRLDAATATKGLHAIERNILVQVQLIEDLLDISRIATGKLVLDVRSTDFTRIVDDAIDVIKPSADAKNISITTTSEPAARTVVADADRLQQIVWNLLANAVKYTPPGGAIKVGLGRADDNVVLVVRDTGQGIAAEMLPYIFDRFSQGPPPGAAP